MTKKNQRQEFELKDFIEKSLLDICGAVENVRKQYSYVAPKFFVDPTPGKETLVEFDVAVALKETNEDQINAGASAQGGFKIAVFSAKTDVAVSGKKASADTSGIENRIKFSVPVHFQFDEEKRKEILDTREQQKNTKMELHPGQYKGI